MSHSQRVLVTGSAGRIGRAVVQELAARKHCVIGFDTRPTSGLPPECVVVASLLDDPALRRAAVGADCVIHLAATPDDARFPRSTPPDDGDNFEAELVPNNIVGAYRVMEAVRTLGISRAVLASTGQVIDGHLRADNVPVTADSPFRPRYLYACTKVFLESLGRVYAEQHGITALVVRLGWCPRDAGQVAEIASRERFQDVFLSPGDAGRFFAAAVEAEHLPPFAVVYAASGHTHRSRYDLNEAQRLLGWKPRDRWPTGASDFA